MSSVESNTQHGKSDNSGCINSHSRCDEHNLDSSNKDDSHARSSNSNDNRSKWLSSVLAFITETQANSLDLSCRTIPKNKVVSILTTLTKSQITELDLNRNNLQDTIEYLTKLLGQLRLKKLNVRACDLTLNDLTQLMKLLKGTEITNLDVSSNHILFTPATVRHFVSFLLQSNITDLSMEKNSFNGEAGAIFFQSLSSTSITRLNLNGTMRREEFGDVITSLISILPQTSITDLDLSYNRLTLTELEKLSESLGDSKLRKLSLSMNSISDTGVCSLTKGLVNSKIVYLDLSYNKIFGFNNLGCILKQTHIKTLNISENKVECGEMFNIPNFLRGSTVSFLNVYGCCLGDEIGQKLMKSLAFTEIDELNVGKNNLEIPSILEFSQILKHTNLTSVDFSLNFLSPEALSTIGDSLQESKLKNVNLRGNIETFKNECTLVERLTNTSLTHVNLSGCKLNPTAVLSLGAAVRHTAVTHLELEGNDLGDEGLETLAECLKQTQIIKLNISRNSITSKGAIILADALKDTNFLYINLKSNPIRDDGVSYLADKISSTCITVLDLRSNYLCRESDYIIDRALWENRKIVQQLIHFFKRIAPETNSNNFQFDCSADSVDLSSLLEDCLFLYKIVVERSSSLNVLALEQTISYSKSQIANLMLEEFPRQLAMFIAQSVEADLSEHVNFLRRIEELGLSQITEHLLLHRPLYVVDKTEDILHPYVYKLMHKYKQTIVNSSIEPLGKHKIIKYFTKHGELEGASEVILLLRQNSNDSTIVNS